MLSKPEHGWTDFQLDGTSVYALSYLDDIPFDWLDRAIAGLQTGTPFCVRGSLEPGDFTCTVTLRCCQIARTEPFGSETSNTGMLAFCKALHRDISRNAQAWAVFASGVRHSLSDGAQRRKQLQRKLDQLKQLILQREGQPG